MKQNRLDDLRNSPLYTQKEASLYLNIPRSTLRYWAVGEQRDSRKVTPIIKKPNNSRCLSFLNLVELHVLNALRSEHHIELPKIRKSLDYVKQRLNVDRPLLEKTFETDGVDIFIERYGTLVNISKQGQQAMRELLRSSLKRVVRDSHKIPVKLFPYTRTSIQDSPKFISISPSLFSGRPVIDGTGVSTAIVAERHKAGESLAELASDYNLSEEKIEEAIRCELRFAA